MARILVTTDYLYPGDEVDALLRRHGHQVSHHPAVGKRAAELPVFRAINSWERVWDRTLGD